VVTICTMYFNIRTLNFAHTVYLCVSYDSYSKQQLLIHLNSINWLVFVMVMLCVVYEVGTEFR
jgi:hypothetical protein